MRRAERRKLGIFSCSCTLACHSATRNYLEFTTHSQLSEGRTLIRWHYTELIDLLILFYIFIRWVKEISGDIRKSVICLLICSSCRLFSLIINCRVIRVTEHSLFLTLILLQLLERSIFKVDSKLGFLIKEA